MATILVKRGRGDGFDEMSEPNCSPHRAMLLESPANKRTRAHEQEQHEGGAAAGPSNSPFMQGVHQSSAGAQGPERA